MVIRLLRFIANLVIIARVPSVLHYSVVFLVIAIVTATFGLGGVVTGAVETAKILFFLFAILAAISFVASLVRKS